MPMEEFDFGSSECSTEDLEHANNPNLWLCGASKSSMRTDGSQWCKEVMIEDYMPYLFQEELMEPVEWIHCLATLDATTLQSGPKFCDEDGYDVHPLNMIDVVEPQYEELQVSNLMVEEVSVEDVLIERVNPDESRSELTNEPLDDKDWEVSEGELEKI